MLKSLQKVSVKFNNQCGTFVFNLSCWIGKYWSENLLALTSEVICYESPEFTMGMGTSDGFLMDQHVRS